MSVTRCRRNKRLVRLVADATNPSVCKCGFNSSSKSGSRSPDGATYEVLVYMPEENKALTDRRGNHPGPPWPISDNQDRELWAMGPRPGSGPHSPPPALGSSGRQATALQKGSPCFLRITRRLQALAPHCTAAALKLCSHCSLYRQTLLIELNLHTAPIKSPTSCNAVVHCSFGEWTVGACNTAPTVSRSDHDSHCDLTQIGSHNPAALGRWSRYAPPNIMALTLLSLSHTLLLRHLSPDCRPPGLTRKTAQSRPKPS